MEYELGYREVIPDQNFEDKWQEITLTTGGSQSTLQDIKVPERAGGFSYKNSFDNVTRNRFISWRIIHDILELSEHSLDVNLANNRVKYKLTDTPILDSISIHETDSMVIILVATVSSIHKLSFPHPRFIQKQGPSVYMDSTIHSIFSEANIYNARDPHTFYVVPTSGLTSSTVAHAAASWLVMPDEEALFAFAFNSGIILLLRLNSVTGIVNTSELKIESIVPRFLSGIATALRGKATETEVSMSIVIQTYGNDVYLFTFCREGNLRMWSCSTGQCVAVIDVFTSESSLEIIQHHNLRKISNSDHGLYLCTYIKLESRCEFSIFKVLQDTTYTVNRICTLLTPKQHLVDFSFTSTRLWALWRLDDTDAVAVTHICLPLANTNLNCQWESVVLSETPFKDYITSDPGTDPRQAYLDFIFHPGQFAMADIVKALNIYRRSNLAVEVKLSPSVLKERVCVAVEAEIQAEVIDYELMDEDYLEIVNRCWSKFYSCVLQYHMNRYRPIGFLLLPTVYGVVLLKKYSFSFLRPMEKLEYLMLCNQKSHSSLFKQIPILQDNGDKSQDVIELMLILVFLEEHLSDDFKSSFERELFRLKTPNSIIESLMSSTIPNGQEPFSDFDFHLELDSRLENIKEISNSINSLLEIITYNLDQLNSSETNPNVTKTQQLYSNIIHYFGSQLGVSVISKTVAQIISIRFSICRNLLVLQQIGMDRHKPPDSESIHSNKSSLVAKTVIITQAYYLLLWISEINVSVNSSQTLLDTSAQRIALLSSNNSQTNFTHDTSKSFSLLEIFIQYGMRQYINKFAEETENVSNFHVWHSGLFIYATFIIHLIWPITTNFYFPEWLLANCQFLVIQEYVRLLSSWCACNSASRKFILAVSLLEMGELHKASDNFLRASSGVIVDSYMSILFRTKNHSKNKALLTYYLKVIELFEQYNAEDIVIELAMTAIAVTKNGDSNLPTLHSIVFAQHLNLQHHIEAYNCLNINPDSERRIDCLRQLAVALFSRKKLKDLISFPYVGMYQDLERIMEARARSVDLMENNYYDFLYSFHINKGNIRKAASVMYEQASRFSQEPHSLFTVSKQANCLLICINVLSLANTKSRWIVSPVFDCSLTEDSSNLQKKRNAIGQEILKCNRSKHIELLELQDIKMEYVLVSAKLKLTKLDIKGHNLSSSCPMEIVSLLSNYGLYVDALRICKYYKLSKTSILENLASKCVRLNGEELSKHPGLFSKTIILDYTSSISTAANTSWNLLKDFISQYEEIGKSELHKAVTKQLLHHEIFLPEWLYSSYSKRNASEFLRLLVEMGRLEEATHLSIKYIQALLGRGKEYFGSEISLSVSTSASTYFPLTYLDILLLELKNATKTDKAYLTALQQLECEYDVYLKSVEKVSINTMLMKKNMK